MRCWAAIVSEEMFAGERLYAFDSLVLPEASQKGTRAPGDGDSCDVAPDSVAGDSVAPGGVSPGDVVALLVGGEPRLLFGLGRIRERLAAKEELAIAYTDRLFDDPLPVGDLPLGPVERGLTELDPSLYARLAARVSAQRRGDADRSQWLVSVTLPIEAASRAEAVREFWTYLAKLGPRELPAFVWPQGDELAMQAFVQGEETNLDPEEE
jgi:hypothetical protein